MKKKIILGILFLILVIMGIGFYPINGDKIAKNVYVEDINIGNLTKIQAKEKLNNEYKMKTFNFQYKENEWHVKPQKLDASYDIEKTIDNAYEVNREGNIVVNIFESLKSIMGEKTEINIAIDCDEDKLERELEKISEDINIEVKNATLKVENNEIEVIKEESGLELDVKSSKTNFMKNLQNGNFTEELIVVKIEPEIISSELEKIDSLLASYTTVLSDISVDRVENIKLASERTSNILLMPGQEFSYNKYTGMRSIKNGYKSAHVISGGQVTEGIGGGVCQVSSTLFNSVLYAGLDIVSRTNHSIPSTYVDLGRDATVTDSGIDFVFKNNYKNPVFIKNYYFNGKVTCQIFGVESDKQKIDITKTVNSTIPYGTTEYKDSSLVEGMTKILESGRTGYSVTTYRIYYDENGKEIKKENVCTSYYPSKNAVVAVGTNSLSADKNTDTNKTPVKDNANYNSGNDNSIENPEAGNVTTKPMPEPEQEQIPMPEQTPIEPTE